MASKLYPILKGKERFFTGNMQTLDASFGISFQNLLFLEFICYPGRLGNQVSDVFRNKCMKQDSSNVSIFSSSLCLRNAISQIGMNSSLLFVL